MQGKDIIFFDLDGTLTDSKEGIFASLRYALRFFGITEQQDEALNRFIGPPLVQAFITYYHMSEQDAALALVKYREYFSTKGIYQLSMYSGVDRMLKELKKRNFTLCLATSKPEQYAKEIISRIGVKDQFDYLAGATMDESRNEKKDIINFVIAQKGYDRSRILMVGDREHDVYGAHKNHVEVLGVLYGYGTKKELKDAGCNYFAKTVEDVEMFILS